MAASHSAVGTGGKSAPRWRISASWATSSMAALLYHLDQVAEGGCLGGFGMHEEDGGPARALARSGIDQLEAVLLHVVVSGARVRDPQGHVRQPPASPVLLDLLGH